MLMDPHFFGGFVRRFIVSKDRGPSILGTSIIRNRFEVSENREDIYGIIG
jgi:hypothetical protein